MLLATVQLTIASVLTLRQLGGSWVAGPRDSPREVTRLSGRFVRTHRNLLEIFPQSSRLYFWCMPPGVRPVCWLAAWVGILLIAVDVFV